MDDSEPKKSIKVVSGGLQLLAWLLILGGVFIALFILQELFNTYQHMDSHSFVGSLINLFSDSTLLSFANQPLEVTTQGATILAYFLFALFALLGCHIAIAFIRAGTHILSPTFPYQFARLKERINRISSKVDR